MSYFDDRQIVVARNRFGNSFEGYRKIYPGIIASFGGSTTFDQLGDQWTWVNVWSRPESLVPMLNPTSLSEEGTRVLCARDPRPPNRWRIISVDDAYSSETAPIPWAQFNIGVHGGSHQILDEASPGPDPTLVGTPMLYPLKTVGDGATLTVSTYPYDYNHGGYIKSFAGADTDLTSYVPGTGLVRRVLFYLDRTTNLLQVVAGATVPDTGAMPIPVPLPPHIETTKSAWVTLAGGQSTITTATDIINARDPFDTGSFNAVPDPTTSGQILMSDTRNWQKPMIGEDGNIMIDENYEIMYE
jgi:hypothetical protein